MALDDSESEEEEEEGTDMESDLEGKKEEGKHELSCISPGFGLLSYQPV